MAGFEPVLALLVVGLACGFLRVRMVTWSALSAAALLLATLYGSASWVTLALTWLVFGAVVVVLNHRPLRLKLLTQPMLDTYQRIAPQLSETERVALEAGTVGWEGELFSGRPRWSKLLTQPAPQLSGEERAFLDGPVEEVCAMTNDWEITHERNDLPPQVWDYLKRQKFFGMIIPKSFGGLGFSAHAHSAVLQKLASISATLNATVAVPNSLGPAELLLHYGTEEQKNHYLPRLADGREIPCFGLTNPTAGSDATSIPDFGIVCQQIVDGKEVLGLKLTFEKRYITLAPVATVIGLAFRMYDPDRLLSEQQDIGITLALIPRSTPGLDIGRRHLPMNIPFHNGPISATEMFVPLDCLIGGQAYAGQGWRMLVECLSVGRAISLPSGSTGAVRMAALATGAYARIRKQFGMSIGRFEGVEEALARIGGLTYAVSALSRMTAAAVDLGEKPAVPSAIAKYHATELGRTIIQDAMDIHGGKSVILGPKNYLGRSWQGAPIGITVEGANILTRNMIIFGQGAVRCHPYVLKLMQAAGLADHERRLAEFDKTLLQHAGFAVSNACRSFLYGLTHSRIGSAPGDTYTARYFRKLSRYSAALALVSDTSMLLLGGKLKQKERISARLGDVLSNLYIASALLKRFEDHGRPELDRPLLAWAFHDCIHRIQVALDGVLRNFPIRPAAWLLRVLVFPIGRLEAAPGDRLGRRVASLLMYPNEARDRLGEFCYLSPTANNPAGQMNSMLGTIIEAEPIERRVAKAQKSGALKALEAGAVLVEAVQFGVITEGERELLERSRAAVTEIISVDDFDTADLVAGRRHDAAQRVHLRSAA